MPLNLPSEVNKSNSLKYKKGTKDLIVEALTDHHPLSLKELFEKIVRGNQLFITYPAVRKAAKELVANSILIQDGRKYELNKDWIVEMRTLIERMQANYLQT